SDANGNVLSFSASGLPAGLAVSSGGAISGTVTTAGTYNVVVAVTDGALSAQRAFTWTVVAPVDPSTDPAVTKPVKPRGNSGNNSTTTGNGRTKTTRSTSTSPTTAEYTGLTAVSRESA